VGILVSLIDDIAGGGDAQDDDLNSIEDVVGSDFSDILIGDDGHNRLLGRRGGDTLKGYGGEDSLEGGDGDDSLSGMDGADDLFGDAGLDTLNGGRGNDAMWGGPGGDTFVWSSINDTSVTSMTCDEIVDFNFAEGDLIDLRDIDADIYADGNQGFAFIGTAAFSGTPGEINYYDDPNDAYTIIQLQIGTSADPEGVIRLQGVHVPEASWFML
jgi:serralysin